MEEDNCITWGGEELTWGTRDTTWSFCIYIVIEDGGYNLAMASQEIQRVEPIRKIKRYIKLIVFVEEKEIIETKEKSNLKISKIQKIDIRSSDKKIEVKVD